MQELLKNAWLGWQNYIDHGKLAALFFAALLFLGLSGKMRRQKALGWYGAILGACCVFPLTAALLMLYQTRFYDYEWIWSLVPLTLVIGWGVTEVLTDSTFGRGLRGKESSEKAGLWQRAGITAFAAAVILLCGNPGAGWQPEEKKELDCARDTFQTLSLGEAGESICLLAPREIMEYARVIDSSIQLPYGRNMWDKALNAYSYDVYTREVSGLYTWMCLYEELGSFEQSLTKGLVLEEMYPELVRQWREMADSCVLTMRQEGVNRLLLPGGLRADVLQETEALFGVKAAAAGGYYLLELP